MRTNRYLIILLTLVSLLSCEMNDYVQPEALPAVTQIGKQTFGAKINGTIWTPFQRYKANPNFKPVPVVWGKYQNATLRLSVTNQNTLESMSFMINNVKDTGRYQFMRYFPKNAVEFTPFASVYQKCINGNCSQYAICQTCENEVNITRFDPVSKIYSGTFSVTFQNKEKPSEILALKDGRFDIKE
ncbi:hypothetical protein ABID42_001016 [Arcicella rosea]|uniref:Uncharacterized protein n=1 Tax=Arcicella gelida TaxID=2984195 RepID=A0ABU5S241_9BACT|nr:hypothetical protein [Arcicella sp. DC2W]MEA5402461.1 hypothetical protein [Arcicella sp. DC2W]